MMRSISVKQSLLGILAALGLSYGLLLAVVQFTARGQHALMLRVASVDFPATMTLKEVEAAFEQTQKRYKDAVLLEDPKLLDEADAQAVAVGTGLLALEERLQPVPALAQRARQMVEDESALTMRAQQTYRLLLASNVNVSEEVQAQVGALARDNAAQRKAMNDLEAVLEGKSREAFAGMDRGSKRMRVTAWLLFGVYLVSFGGAWWVLHFNVVARLERLAQRMRGIAEGEGDLTYRIEVRGSDELDEVGRWFNVFIARVEHIVLRVSENALALAGAAETLATHAREVATQSAQQKEAALKISGSMLEISTAASAISRDTQKAAEDARHAEQDAQTGGETIHATVTVIQELLTSNRATREKVAELGAASVAIDKVLQVIYEISRQASLLALNASIEAARAGEHGRGFGVVAGEVQRLAEKTGRNTQEIEETVRAIQRGTAEVVTSMQAATRAVEEGVQRAQTAGAALDGIVEGSGGVRRMVTQIALASSEQNGAAQTVHTNLEEIADLGTRATLSSEKAVTACDRLSVLAADLNALVGCFKVGAATVSV